MAAIVLLLGVRRQPRLVPGHRRRARASVDRIYHLTLPAIALAMTSMALVARVTRSSVRDELGREHVQTAVSRGIPFRLVLRRHVLRNAAIPITTVAGLTIAVADRRRRRSSSGRSR